MRYLGHRIVLVTVAAACVAVAAASSLARQTEGEMPEGARSLLAGTPVRTLSADFVETRHLSVMSVPLESRGRLLFMSPNAVVWEITSPARSRMVFREGRGAIEMPGLGHTSFLDPGTMPAMSEISDSIAAVASQDPDRILAAYAIRYEPPSVLVLEPRGEAMARAIRRMTVTFASPGRIQSLRIDQASGDWMLIAFSNVSINPDIPPGLFDLPERKAP